MKLGLGSQIPCRRSGVQVHARRFGSIATTAASSKSADHASVDREIFSLALPSLCTLLMDPLASMVDSIYVGQLGSNSLAAMNPNTSLYSFIFMIITYALAPATTNLVTSALVRDEPERAGTVVLHALMFASLAGAAVAAALALGSAPVLGVMGCSDALMTSAREYCLGRAWSVPAVMVLTVGQGAFRGLGKLRVTMAVSLVVAVTNIALDPLLMFAWGMGIKGAGVATAAAQWLGAGLYVYLLAVKHPQLRVFNNITIPTVEQMAPFLVSSGHLLVRNVSVMLTWILASSLAVRLGTVAAAAHQILSQVFWLAAFVPEAFTPVAQVLIARSEGEGVPRALEYAQRIMRHATTTGVLVATVIGASALAGASIPQLMSSDPNVLAAASSTLLIVVLLLPPAAYLFSLEGILIGLRDVAYLAKASVLASSVAMVVQLGLSTQLGLQGIWVAVTVFYCTRITLLTIRYSAVQHRAGLIAFGH